MDDPSYDAMKQSCPLQANCWKENRITDQSGGYTLEEREQKNGRQNEEEQKLDEERNHYKGRPRKCGKTVAASAISSQEWYNAGRWPPLQVLTGATTAARWRFTYLS